MSLEIVQTLLSDRRAMLRVSGRLNALTAPELKAQLKRLVEEGYARIVLDLTDVPFVDSSGLAALVSGLKAALQANGALRLAGLSEQARTVFRLTLLERVFEVYPDAALALDSLH